MPYPKQTAGCTTRSVSRITLQQKFIQRVAPARRKGYIRRKLRCVIKAFRLAFCFDAARQGAGFMQVTVIDFRMMIWQTVKQRAKLNVQPARKPFGDKVNSALITMPHVRPHVKKLLPGNRHERPGSD